MAQLTQPLDREGDNYITNPVLNTTPITSREVSHGRLAQYHEHGKSHDQVNAAQLTQPLGRDECWKSYTPLEDTMEQREPALDNGMPEYGCLEEAVKSHRKHIQAGGIVENETFTRVGFRARNVQRSGTRCADS